MKLKGWIIKLPENMKKYAIGAGVLLLLSLIPILVLGRYNVMCIDDYDYGRRVHDTWMATGSLWESFRTAWQQNMELYREWQGTYVSCFLMALCPMNFIYQIAWIVPIIMIGMLAISTFMLGRHILCTWLGADKERGSFVMFMLLFMFYQVIEAAFEGIYWYNGATHYVLMESVWFFTLTLISASVWVKQKSGEVLYCAAASVLAFVVGGGNLVTGLQAEIIMVLLIIYSLAVNRKKVIIASIPFITGSIGFMINVLAPGNTQRDIVDTGEGYSAISSVLLSFYHAVAFIIRWTPAFVILIWLMLLPVLWKIAKQSSKAFDHPVWVTLGAFCILSAMFTPTLYAIGEVGLSRVDNIIQMVYYLCLVMVTVYWLGYFAHRNIGGNAAPAIGEGADTASLGVADMLGMFLEKAGIRMTAVCLLLVLIVWVCTADKNTYTSISALRSLVNGEAQTFYAEAMERYEIYMDDAVTDVELKPYSAKPALFDFSDLSEDPGNWLNLAVMQYYHKTGVRIVEE